VSHLSHRAAYQEDVTCWRGKLLLSSGSKFDIEDVQSVFFRNGCLMKAYTISESRKHHYHRMVQQPLVGQGLLIAEASRSYSDTVGRTALGEWSTRRKDLYLIIHNTHKRRAFMPPPHPPRGIRTRNPSNTATAGPHLRSHGHCDRQRTDFYSLKRCDRNANWPFKIQCLLYTPQG